MISSPLCQDGWLEFNQAKWGLRPLRLRYPLGETNFPTVEAVVYLDGRGRIVQPRLNAYLPVAFRSTCAQSQIKVYRQWLDTAALLAQEMRARGVRSAVVFPSDIADVRPWQWVGFRASVRYTFHIDFPFQIGQIDHAPRKKIKQALKAGYRCERVANMEDVLVCLRDTEARQKFQHHLTQHDLQMAHRLLGKDSFRVYVCYAPNGEVASARIVLHQVGSKAVDWVAGTRTDHLQRGATQLTISYVLEDLQNAGANGFDFAGADLPGVSAAKMNWGGRLVPMYRIEAYTLRTVVFWASEAFQFLRGSFGKRATSLAGPNVPDRAISDQNE